MQKYGGTAMKILLTILIIAVLIAILIFSITSSDTSTDQNALVVETDLGVIIGYYKNSFEGRKYAVFTGVPYALPPVGNRRFQPPEPIKKWTGNLNATKASKACLQYFHANRNPDEDYPIKGDEDCLYLNIYKPIENNTKSSMPVLFYIHGGAFQFGEGQSADPKFLMDKNIIVVTINFRLGILGFLSTEDEFIPSNMGLKDQSLALHWVSENIKHFGGDPKRITLVGLSSGAASVHYHYLSPLSKGLFQNGISLSGTVLGPGKYTENSREKAQKLGAILACPTNNISIMIKCLQDHSARHIVEAEKQFMPWLYNPFTPFGPVVEKFGDKPFINRSPVEILRSGDAADVLWITTVVSEEGLYPVAEYVNSDEYLEELDKQWEFIAPHLLDFNFTIPLEKHKEVSWKIREHYFGHKSIDRNTVRPLTYMVGNRLYAVHAESAARLQAQYNTSPVYFYYYSYRALTSMSDYYSKTRNNYGVSHGDDNHLIFYNSMIYAPDSPRDRAMQIKLIDFVVSVVENGVPDFGIKWKRVDPTKESLDFLHIASPDYIYMSNNSNFAHKIFWKTIDFDENKI